MIETSGKPQSFLNCSAFAIDLEAIPARSQSGESTIAAAFFIAMFAHPRMPSFTRVSISDEIRVKVFCHILDPER